MNKKLTIIGSGFAGLSAACYAAKDGYDVHLIEKNESPGGRASKFEAEGFVLIWGQAGTGCQMFLNHFLQISIKNLPITTT